MTSNIFKMLLYKTKFPRDLNNAVSRKKKKTKTKDKKKGVEKQGKHLILDDLDFYLHTIPLVHHCNKKDRNAHVDTEMKEKDQDRFHAISILQGARTTEKNGVGCSPGKILMQRFSFPNSLALSKDFHEDDKQLS